MSPLDVVLIIALSAYAVYKQTQRTQAKGPGRFKMAIIYGIVGVCVGGFNLPSGVGGIIMLVLSLLLSVVVGLARGRYTRIWSESDGTVMKQGTALTVALFLGMIVAKFALGTWAHFAHIDDGEGFGAVLVMIALMAAVQAELIWQRVQKLPRVAPAAVPA